MKKITANGTNFTIISRQDVQNWLNEYQNKEDYIEMLKLNFGYTVNLMKEARELLAEDPKALDSEDIATLDESIKKLEVRLAKAVSDMELLGTRILLALESIPNPEVRQVMSLRYLEKAKLEYIAYKLELSLSKVKYLHRAGLDYLADKI